MPARKLEPSNLGHNEDWYGNNAAFTCPNCGNVFIVSAFCGGRRVCSCGKATAYCSGSPGKGEASITWEGKLRSWYAGSNGG
jgi:predicted RNA-binding Zn-ribbon protein involved in translation (DUF1610 family)